MITKPIEIDAFAHRLVMIEANKVYDKLSPLFKYCLYIFIVADFTDYQHPAYSLKSAWSDNNIEGSQTKEQIFSELSEAIDRIIKVVNIVYV